MRWIMEWIEFIKHEDDIQAWEKLQHSGVQDETSSLSWQIREMVWERKKKSVKSLKVWSSTFIVQK